MDAPTVAGSTAALPDLQSILVNRTGRAVHILNDISAAAWQVSTTLAAKRFMVVTVSSGIGSKIFDRSSSQGVLDDVPYAGEIGHLTVDEAPDAPRCDCGGSGHLGAIASGRGIERQARRLAQSDPAFRQSVCALQLGGIPETLNNEEHLVPGDGIVDFRRVFRRLTEQGYTGPFTLDFGDSDVRAEWRERFAGWLGDGKD